MDLPSESREKSIQKLKNCHALGRPTYVQLPKPTTESREMSRLHSPTHLVAFWATGTADYCLPAPTGIRIIALATRKACVRANGRASAKLERKLSSTPPKPLPISHTTCARG